MTALQKFRIAAAVMAFGTPTAVAGSVEYETHPATGILCGILLAGAGSIVALAYAAAAADEQARARVQAAAVDDTPPSARTPLFEEPSSVLRDAAYADGQVAGYEAGYKAGYEAGAAPSTARHAAATTRIDESPVADTAVMDAVVDDSAEELAAQASAEAAEDSQAAPAWEGFFAAASARQAEMEAA